MSRNCMLSQYLQRMPVGNKCTDYCESITFPGSTTFPGVEAKFTKMEEKQNI